MERQRGTRSKRHVDSSQERSFDTGSPERNRMMGIWWNTFNHLARTPSESGVDAMTGIKQVVRNIYSQEHFQRRNVIVEEMGENGPLVIAIPEYNPNGQQFTPRILAGHLDTVRGTERNPEIQDGVVYSHGPSIDNKVPVAAIITVTDAIVAQDIPHPALRVVFTADEETDSRQIDLTPVGTEESAFIADKSGPIGTIVLGSGGYTGIEANIENIPDERMQEFLTRFDRRLGQHAIARRRESVGNLPEILQGRQFTIECLLIGPNNSRNTIPSEGHIRGSFSCAPIDETEQINDAIVQWVAPLGATVTFLARNNTSQEFEISFHGKAGHTSKVGTREDDGMTTVLTDATALFAPFTPDCGDSVVSSSQEVRINIGNMSIRRGQQMNMEFTGEARYRDGNDARIVLDDLRNLVEEFGGSFEATEENRAYQLDPTAASVREMRAVLEANGFAVNFLTETFGISDANNAPRQWNTIVFSDGSINPHRSDEAISLESVDGLLSIFYDLATGKYS